MQYTNTILSHISCPQKYYYRYVRRFKKEGVAVFRLGGAIHDALEAFSLSGKAEDGYKVIAETYSMRPPYVPELEWNYEREVVEALFVGYIFYWKEKDDDIQIIEIEKKFNVGEIAGKMDGIVEKNGKLLLLERKTTSSDLSDVGYWRKLNFDQQILMYMIGARLSGYNVEGVLYDVIKKPTFKPKEIPQTDGDGFKIVIDEISGERQFTKSGKPRESCAKGMTMLKTPETPEHYGERILQDIQQNPEKYYQRREINVLENDIEKFKSELQNKIKLMEIIRKEELFCRNVSFTCRWCDYESFCLEGQDPEAPPPGFIVEELDSPELEQLKGEE